MRNLFLFLLTLLIGTQGIAAQELNVKVTVNHSKVGNTTRTDVFEDLGNKVTAFMNEHRWTDMQFREQERINCNMGITVNTYKEEDNAFTCSMLLTVSRPVFNSTYTTTIYSVQDNEFNFEFQNTDQLEYAGPERIDNNLVALLSYYAYIIVGYDMDCMEAMGGTRFFNIAEDIVSTADNLGQTGWKAFGDSNNRFGLLNDYLDGSMQCYRQLMYDYHRKGLDQMAENVDAGRDVIREALNLLEESRSARNMSHLPQLFSEYKKEELVNIFSKKGSSEERESVYDMLLKVNPALSNEWDKIKE